MEHMHINPLESGLESNLHVSRVDPIHILNAAVLNVSVITT